MTTRDFLDQISPHEQRPLRWRADDTLVPGGYHLTEIKATQVHAMDCGGSAGRWDETVLQILPPAVDADEASMTVAKFLAIFTRVATAVPLADGAHVRIEYGRIGQPAVGYLIDGIEVDAQGVEVRLAPPTVACKGADPTVEDVPVLRERPAEAAGSVACCGTPVAVAEGACC